MIGMIVAVSPDGVIGVDNRIPWRYPADLKRFKRLTTGTTIIMGRSTYESIGKPLPDRRNIVITSRDIPGVECFTDIRSALETTTGDVWFVGGARIYAEAMAYADLIDVTYVPDRITDPRAIRFPAIDPSFTAGPRQTHPDDPRLEHRVFRRVSASAAPSK
jgi:dihydrofolate reductase